MQGYLESRPQLERGTLGSVVISGGLNMKLLEIWVGGVGGGAGGGGGGRLAEAWQKKRWRTGSQICRSAGDGHLDPQSLPAVMDDRVAWGKRAMGEWEGVD